MQTKSFFFITLAFFVLSCSERGSQNQSQIVDGELIKLEKSVLKDKIMGGWAGQVIGCTYGGPTEFQWNGTMIGDHVPIPWDENRMLWYYEHSPGLYDDVYMDLTFVDVYEKHGLDAPDSLHALAFANAEYPLWHANQAARYNILNGIMPPASGFWKNNPHADDIDFQIESDFAGLMSPGMINTAAGIGSKIGHIMNYGDGVYGGIFVASMYTQAFISDDILFVVKEALKTLPAESRFYKTIADVIMWYEMYPDDWKRNWFEIQKKWSAEVGCPDGVFKPFNIDASLNAAYIVLGLLYGEGDFGRTVDISTRAGQDSDCNPSNAAGILGTILGYGQIPAYWKQGLDKVEEMNFQYTDMSLKKVYETGFRHASETILRNGGSDGGSHFMIKYQTPVSLPLEVSFEGLFPLERRWYVNRLTTQNPEISFEMQGCGFVVTGRAAGDAQLPEAILEFDVYAGDKLIETVKMSTSWLKRRHEVAWNYDLTEGHHQISLKARNIPQGYMIETRDIIVYSSNDPGTRVYF